MLKSCEIDDDTKKVEEINKIEFQNEWLELLKNSREKGRGQNLWKKK